MIEPKKDPWVVRKTYQIELEIAAIAREIGKIADELAEIRKNLTPVIKICCPFCNGNNVIKKGRTRNGVQRFYCKDCRITFTAESLIQEVEEEV